MSRRTLEHDWFPGPLPANCTIGERSWLYSSFAMIHCRSQRREAMRVGTDTGLYHGTFFDLGPHAEVHIGDYCSIVGAIFSTCGQIVIGDYVFISHDVVIADSEVSVPPDASEKLRQVPEPSRNVIIEDDVWIGAQATILGGVRIGAGAIIGAAALVDRDVPAFSIYAGNPGRVVGQVDRNR